MVIIRVQCLLFVVFYLFQWLMSNDVHSESHFYARGGNEQACHLIVNNNHHLWTSATSVRSLLRCRSFRNEYALYLKVTCREILLRPNLFTKLSFTFIHIHYVVEKKLSYTLNSLQIIRICYMSTRLSCYKCWTYVNETGVLAIKLLFAKRSQTQLTYLKTALETLLHNTRCSLKQCICIQSYTRKEIACNCLAHVPQWRQTTI